MSIIFWSAALIPAQNKAAEKKAELTIQGITLGDATSARGFLSEYSGRLNENGQPVYFFYNEHGTEILKLTAYSTEHPHLVTDAEIYTVGRSYMATHYVLSDVTSFKSESGFYLGYRPTATSLIFGVPEATRAKEVIRSRGTPDERKKEGKIETLTYRIKEIPGKPLINNYRAFYEFNNNKLRKMKISADVQLDRRKD